MSTRTRTDHKASEGDPPDDARHQQEIADEYIKMCQLVAQASRRLSQIAARRGASTLVARLEAVISEASALRSAYAAPDGEGPESPMEPPASEFDFAVDHLLVAHLLLTDTRGTARQAIEMALYLLACTTKPRPMS